VSAVSVKGLTKDYRRLFGGTQPALRGVDLDIPAGCAFGLIGPNGAGKTTFIKMLLGVARPSAGAVKVLGGDPEDASVRRRIGYLPERLHLPESFTPLELLHSVASLKGSHESEAERQTLLERVGLGEARKRRVAGFSKGMKQRLGLAVALLGKPELLVLDEPTDGVDPLGRLDIRALLVEESKRGCTVLLNSHLLSETEKVCSQIAILHLGRVLKQGNLEALTAGAHGWSLRFEAKARGLADAGFCEVHDDGSCLFESDDAAALNAALDKARASGAKLLELKPMEKDLEGVLTEALNETRS